MNSLALPHSPCNFFGPVLHDAGLDEGAEDFFRVVGAVVVIHRNFVHAHCVVEPAERERRGGGGGDGGEKETNWRW